MVIRVDLRILDFAVDVAWKGIEGTHNSILLLENKAYNMISLSGIFIGAIVAFLSVGEIPRNISVFLIWESLILMACIVFALGTIWLQKQELLDIFNFVDNIDFVDIKKTKGNFLMFMEVWQEDKIKISKNKSCCLKISIVMFLIALVYGLFFVKGLLFPYN